jgi:hypothetical protein
MLDNGQKQTVGDHSNVVQGGGDVVVNMGLSYAEARCIAQDVAKATFFELAGQAREVMSARVEEITDRVLSKLSSEYPAGLDKAVDPDFQYSLLNVQKEYGKSGDEDLGGLLVDLLVERSKQDGRNILQIVLNESLVIAPKLTKQHLASLAVIYLFRYTANQTFTDFEDFGIYLDSHVMPFIGDRSGNEAAYQHLAFTGCGSRSMQMMDLSEVFTLHYPGLFQKGLSDEDVQSIGFETYIHPPFFIRCLNDSNKCQIKALNDQVLSGLFELHPVSTSIQGKIKDMFKGNLMPPEAVRDRIIELRPYMADVFTWWSGSAAGSFVLTSVGIAIGHANITRTVGEFADLSTWIN